MKTSPSSTRNLIVAILVLAADFSLVHGGIIGSHYSPYYRWPPQFQLAFLGSLPMLNVVVIGGSVILSRGGNRRPFLTGFVLSGAVAVALLLGLILAIPDRWSWPPYNALMDLIRKMTREVVGRGWFDLEERTIQVSIGLALSMMLFTIPESLIAALGGLAARSRRTARGLPTSEGGTPPSPGQARTS